MLLNLRQVYIKSQMGLAPLRLNSVLWPPKSQTVGPLQTNLLAIAGNLENTSTGVRTMGTNTQSIQKGTTATAGALNTIGTTLSSELSGMKDGLKDALSPQELKAMAEGFVSMGANLQEISSGLPISNQEHNDGSHSTKRHE